MLNLSCYYSSFGISPDWHEDHEYHFITTQNVSSKLAKNNSQIVKEFHQQLTMQVSFIYPHVYTDRIICLLIWDLASFILVYFNMLLSRRWISVRLEMTELFPVYEGNQFNKTIDAFVDLIQYVNFLSRRNFHFWSTQEIFTETLNLIIIKMIDACMCNHFWSQ